MPDRRTGGLGRTAVVTGASAGIGRELARAFARGGYDVLVTARRGERLEALCRELSEAHGIAARALPVDMTRPEAPAALHEAARGGRAPVEVVVNNAGIGTLGPFATTPLDDSLDVLRLNVVAATSVIRLFLPDLLARGRGRILNVASTAAFQPGPLMAVYYATKAYLLHLSEAVAEEVRGTGVTVTTLCPGPTRTEFQARAGMEETRLFGGFWVMDAESVAAAGYRGALAGRRLVVPGLLNKVTAHGVRLLPRALAPRLVAFLQRTGGR